MFVGVVPSCARWRARVCERFVERERRGAMCEGQRYARGTACACNTEVPCALAWCSSEGARPRNAQSPLEDLRLAMRPERLGVAEVIAAAGEDESKN